VNDRDGRVPIPSNFRSGSGKVERGVPGRSIDLDRQDDGRAVVHVIDGLRRVKSASAPICCSATEDKHHGYTDVERVFASGFCGRDQHLSDGTFGVTAHRIIQHKSHGDVSTNIVSCQSELERSFSCYALPDVSHVGLNRGQIVLGDQGVDELDPLVVRSDLLRRPQNQYGKTFSIHRRLTL
jgi:hypothetical protein